MQSTLPSFSARDQCAKFFFCMRLWSFNWYAKFFIRSHNAVIRVYDETGNVIETHEHKGDFKEP
jgi:hypothetical protein